MSKRPYLASFQAIRSDNQLSIQASVTDSYTPLSRGTDNSESAKATSPIQSIALIASDEYKIKLVGLNDAHEEVFIREYESDSFGNFDLKIPAKVNEQLITAFQVYEVSYHPGLQLLLGTYIPLDIQNPKRIIISDFDKTLCDTKFSTTKEIYNSLRKPLGHFPTIKESVDLFKSKTDEGFQPFILSASPHFYEKAIRDWLYQNQIFAGNIFLKDYRNIFSLSEGVLTPKDLKNQGFYKLNQLVNIILMTGIPNHLILMGDGFESDVFIYATLAAILQDKTDPWKIWNLVKKEHAFRLTSKQTSQFLSKFYQLGEQRKQIKDFKMDIHIRCTNEDYERLTKEEYRLKFVQDHRDSINYYIA